MTETIVFLFAGALCALPGIFSRKLPALLILVQGILGLLIFCGALLAAGSVALGSGAALIKEQGIVTWLTLFCSVFFILLCLGFLLGFGIVYRLLSRHSGSETQERAGGLFLKISRVQPAIGFLCIVIALWDCLYGSAVFPLIHP